MRRLLTLSILVGNILLWPFSDAIASSNGRCQISVQSTQTDSSWLYSIKDRFDLLASEARGNDLYYYDDFKLKPSKYTEIKNRTRALQGRLGQWLKSKESKVKNSKLSQWLKTGKTRVENSKFSNWFKPKQDHLSKLAKKRLFSNLTGLEKHLVTRLLFQPKKIIEFLPQLKEIERRSKVIGLVDQLQNISKLSFNKRAFIYFTSLLNSSSEPNAKSYLRKDIVGRMARFGRGLSRFAVWILNPSPIDFSMKRRLEIIYEKIRVNKDKELPEILSSDEMSYLIDYSVLEDTLIFQEHMRGQTLIQKTKASLVNTGAHLFISGALLASAITTATLISPSKIVSSSDYITAAVNESLPKVEIILESKLIPHTALRIGDKIYNPSVMTFQVLRVDDFAKKIKGPRVIQTIELNLSPETISKIEQRFSKVLWQSYDNNTGFYDCTTVISDALREEAGLYIPPVFDVSPTLMAAYFRSQSLLGNGIVKGGQTLYGGDDDKYHLGWRLPLRAIAQSVEVKLAYAFSYFINEKQRKIRNESKLHYTTDQYDELLEQRVLKHVDDLRQNQDISGLIRFLKIAKLRNGLDTSTVKIELETWLTQRKLDLIESWEQTPDYSLYLEYQAKIEAIEQLLQAEI